VILALIAFAARLDMSINRLRELVLIQVEKRRSYYCSALPQSVHFRAWSNPSRPRGSLAKPFFLPESVGLLLLGLLPSILFLRAFLLRDACPSTRV
jgi:hypothetical protein